MKPRQLPDIPQRRTHHYDGSPFATAESGTYSYHALQRIKGRWAQIAYMRVPGDACRVVGEDWFRAHGVPIDDLRFCNQDEWHEIQVRQHLRDVGVKP